MDQLWFSVGRSRKVQDALGKRVISVKQLDRPIGGEEATSIARAAASLRRRVARLCAWKGDQAFLMSLLSIMDLYLDDGGDVVLCHMSPSNSLGLDAPSRLELGITGRRRRKIISVTSASA